MTMARGTLHLPKLVDELRVVVDWFSLGLQLGIPHEQLKKISVECRGNVERCKIEMLNFWLNNSSVSYELLVTSLHSIGLGNLAAKLQAKYGVVLNFATVSPLDESRNPVETKEVVRAKYMIQQEDKKIREHYAQFMLELQRLLEEKKSRVNDIKVFFNCLQRDDKALTVDMRKANSIPSFMQSLSRTQSWWDFKISSTIAHRFGGDKGIQLVESYEAKLKVHLLKRITLKLPIVGRASEIVVKIDRDYKKYTEESFGEFRDTLSRLLQLDPLDFIFLYAEEGCIKLTFLFSSFYINHVKVRSTGITKFEEHGVISLSIDGVTLWSRTQKEQDTKENIPKSKRIKAIEDHRYPGQNTSKKYMKRVLRGVDLFTPVQQHSMRCPRKKHYLLVLLIVFVLILLYILFHLYHTL